MGNFSKAIRHLDVDKIKRKRIEEAAALKLEEDKLEDEKRHVISTMEKVKYDWRSDDNSKNLLREKMTTSAVMSTHLGADHDDNPGEEVTIDASLEASFADGPDNSLQYMMFKAVSIKDAGSGSGSGGGFNIGKHLAFSATTNSDGSDYQASSSRHAMLAPIDARNMDSITITAIRGNDSNGGELPDEPDEDLRIYWYTTNTEVWNQGEGGRWQSLKYDYDGNLHNDINDTIIPRVPGDIGGYDGSDPGLRDWTLEIPEWCRRENVRFMLYQQSHSGHTWDHYGVKAIKYNKKVPSNVFVPLDSPEASSFIRMGEPASLKSSAKKRKKKIEKMLAASKKYTEIAIGKDFPGMGTKLDPSAASPIGKDEVAKAHRDAGTLSQQLKKALAKDQPVDKEESPVTDKIKDTIKAKPKLPAKPKVTLEPQDTATLKALKSDGIPNKQVRKFEVLATKEIEGKLKPEERAEYRSIQKTNNINQVVKKDKNLLTNSLNELDFAVAAGAGDVDDTEFGDTAIDTIKTGVKVVDTVAKGLSGKSIADAIEYAGTAVGLNPFGARDSTTFSTNLATSLTQSILTGQPIRNNIQFEAMPSVIEGIDFDKLAENLTIGDYNGASAKTTIYPESNKAEIFQDGNGWGRPGGVVANYNPSDKTFTLKWEKTLRTGTGDKVSETGKIERFADIPEVTKEDVDKIVQRVTEYPVTHRVLSGFASITDVLNGRIPTSKGSVYEQFQNNPEFKKLFMDGLQQTISDINLADKANNLVQGTASNIVALRKILTNLGLPQSEVEKTNGGFGQVFTEMKLNDTQLKYLESTGKISTETYNQLKGVIDKKVNDPYSDRNYKNNLPNWFQFSGKDADGNIWGYNYSGGYGVLSPGEGSGELGTAESGYGTPGYDWNSNSGGTSWSFTMGDDFAKTQEDSRWKPVIDSKTGQPKRYLLGDSEGKPNTYTLSKDSDGNTKWTQIDPETGEPIDTKGEEDLPNPTDEYGREYDPEHEMSDEVKDRLRKQRVSIDSIKKGAEQAPYMYNMPSDSTGEGESKVVKIWGRDRTLYSAPEYTYWDGSGWTPSRVDTNHYQGHAADGYFSSAMSYIFGRGPDGLVYPNISYYGKRAAGSGRGYGVKPEQWYNTRLKPYLNGKSVEDQIAYYRNFGKTSWKFATTESDGRGGTRRVPGYYRPGETYFQEWMASNQRLRDENGLTSPIDMNDLTADSLRSFQGKGVDMSKYYDFDPTPDTEDGRRPIASKQDKEDLVADSIKSFQGKNVDMSKYYDFPVDWTPDDKSKLIQDSIRSFQNQKDIDFGDYYDFPINNTKELNNTIQSINNNTDLTNTDKLGSLNRIAADLVKNNNTKELSQVRSQLIDTGINSTKDTQNVIMRAIDGISNWKGLDGKGNTMGQKVDAIGDFANGIKDGFGTLFGVMGTLSDAEKNGYIKNGKIIDGKVGSYTNPSKISVSDSTAQDIIGRLNLNNYDGEVWWREIDFNTSLDPINGNLGAKGIHNNLGYGVNNKEKHPYLNDNGDLVIPDTYAFRPHGHVRLGDDQKGSKIDIPIPGGGKDNDIKTVDMIGSLFGLIGGDSAKNWAVDRIGTILDQSLGFLIPGIPDEYDPTVHFETIIPKDQLDRVKDDFFQTDKTVKMTKVNQKTTRNQVANLTNNLYSLHDDSWKDTLPHWVNKSSVSRDENGIVTGTNTSDVSGRGRGVLIPVDKDYWNQEITTNYTDSKGNPKTYSYILGDLKSKGGSNWDQKWIIKSFEQMSDSEKNSYFSKDPLPSTQRETPSKVVNDLPQEVKDKFLNDIGMNSSPKNKYGYDVLDPQKDRIKIENINAQIIAIGDKTVEQHRAIEKSHKGDKKSLNAKLEKIWNDYENAVAPLDKLLDAQVVNLDDERDGAWKHFPDSDPYKNLDNTGTEVLPNGIMRELKSRGLTDAQIRRVLEAGGAQELKDFANGDIYAQTADERANSIVARSQGNINNISEKDLQYLMDIGYPIDDWLYGGKTASPVGDLIGLGLTAAGVKLLLPALMKAGGSLVSLVKTEWGQRAITDAAYKTFKATGGKFNGNIPIPGTGVLPPWYHWAVWKQLPQPVLNTYAKVMGLKEAPFSVLTTGGTPAGNIGLGVLGVAGLAKFMQHMFDGKTNQANTMLKDALIEDSNTKIDNMNTESITDNVDEIWNSNANAKGIEEVYNKIYDKNPTMKKYDDLWQEEDKIWTDYEQYGQDESNLRWKLYRAQQEIAKPYYGVTGHWDQEGWVNTHDNEGYADSILGRGDAAQKALDEFKYQPSVWDGDKLVSGGGSWDEKTQWDRSPYSYANYQKIEKAWSDSYPVETKGKDSNASAKMSDAKDKSFVKLYNKVKSAFGIDPQTVSRGTKVPSPVNDVISQWNSMWSKYDSALKAWQNENDKLNTWNKKEINRLQGEVDRLDKEAENYRQTHMNPLWDAQRKARELGKEIADIDLELSLIHI